MKRMYLVLCAERTMKMGDLKGNLPEGQYYAPIFEKKAEAERYADGKYSIMELDVGGGE